MTHTASFLRHQHRHVHLRCLSTGDGHLRSQSNGLKIPENFQAYFIGCNVYADYLAIPTYHDGHFIFV